jgi:hypothetical protein
MEKKAKKLAFFLHKQTRLLGLDTLDISCRFKKESYKITIFNHKLATKPRVMFLKFTDDPIPPHLTVFEHPLSKNSSSPVDTLFDQQEKLRHFIERLSEERLQHYFTTSLYATLFLKEENPSTQVNRILDRINDYKHLYDLFQDEKYLRRYTHSLQRLQKIKRFSF